ncbi:lysosomal Pro-X carboxypeptidase-like [Neltuma alba]|uniref:lysosomal Pro-X carboxypeptidase-like n=1 Tax=Neltuma alba TaxID=207710 RepID=UPI0010A341AE|nr:lysosomal Pro-X carboxypeptidase-like [Prosopis alba]
MKHSSLPFQWLLFVFLIHITCLSETQSITIPGLSAIEGTTLKDQETLIAASDTGDFKTFYYNQTLDHFNYGHESYTDFQQRYLINFKYWGGANSSAPIFAYFGAEAPLDLILSVVGFPTDNAAAFSALVVFIEHRYYGESVPFGSREEAMNTSTIGYFNSAQALADYAEILIHIKETLQAQQSPMIVFGGSYGGMLASWFRLKYPHVALGALASFAPILYFDNITPQNGYISIVSKDFREASETCHETILNSWPEIDRVASEPNGLSILSQRFNTCRPLNSSSELRRHLEDMYARAAQYNHPPLYPVSGICGAIDGASSGSDILSKIYEGVVAYYKYKGNDSCKFNGPANAIEKETAEGWGWQRCSEMVMQIERGNGTMFPPEPFDLRSFMEQCERDYGVLPRPHWVTTYYGGHDIKLILQRFASNIIFSNGLRDPFSAGGVLHNISDSVIAISTVNGSHCLDMLRANQSDPDWLIQQRRQEVDIIKSWIAQYYADLRLLNRTQS